MTVELEVEVVLEAEASVGEGPVWDERTNVLVWVDIMNNALHTFDPVSGQDRQLDVGQPVGAAALRDGGGLVLACVTDSDCSRMTRPILRMVSDVEADLPGNRFNDGKCDAAGRFGRESAPIGSRCALSLQEFTFTPRRA
jgi:sugar lactone lactonase YvrE